MPHPPSPVGPILRRDHPCATAFLDETGSIASDRVFAVGLLKLHEPSRMLRAAQKWRDKHHWYKEIKFSRVTAGTLDLYKEIIDLCLGVQGINFFCFVADRDAADPVARFGTHWDAYGRLAEQLVVAVIRPPELLALVADNYSTPDTILFEENLRQTVNRRLGRLAVVSVCRMDSRASDGLQIADLLTSATAYEFRQSKGTCWKGRPKGLACGSHAESDRGLIVPCGLPNVSSQHRSVRRVAHNTVNPESMARQHAGVSIDR